MNPVLKRILLHGGGTALVLAVVGFGFAEVAGIWVASGTRQGSTVNPPVNESLRYRVPMMMAFWGFAFVAVMEVVLTRFRKPAPPKPAEPAPDDAEKLLNELLAQAEAKMALEAEGQKTEGQKPEDRGQEAEKKPESEQPKPPAS